MSKGEKRKYKLMRSMADLLLDKLIPACQVINGQPKIEIVGSLRRGANHPQQSDLLIGDIEFVLVPTYQTTLLGADYSSSAIDPLLASWNVPILLNGSRKKKFIVESKKGAFTVELWLQTVDTWGVAKMIGTGSARFSRRMVTSTLKRGYMPAHLIIEEKRVKHAHTSEIYETRTEKQLFDLFEMEYIEPHNRI